jgi:hypothetical protein
MVTTLRYRNEVGSHTSGADQLVLAVGVGILLFGALMAVVTSVASASPYTLDSYQSFSVAPALQSTATPTATTQITPTSTYSFSLAALGYAERTLTSSHGRTQFSFRLPENWAIQTDGVLDLDLSYNYQPVNTDGYPAQFGDLTVTFDDQTLEIFSITQAELEHYRLRVPIPVSLLASPVGILHTIDVTLDASLLCTVPHKAKLVIHPTSSISLTHGQRPPVLDLARYPRPFYQRAFEPDSVRFALPAKLTASDLSNALAVAAKLGDLTGDRMAIRATADSDLQDLLGSAPATLDEHLIVIGQPEHNQLLSLLDDTMELPVSLHQQQLGLVIQGPAAIAQDGTFTYSFTVTNTLDKDLELSLVSAWSPRAELVECMPECTQNSGDHSVTWRGRSLAPAEAMSFSLALEVTDLLSATIFDNTVTLIEAELGPVNAQTLTATLVATSPGSESRTSSAKQGDYFFVYDDKAVAAEDGIIQEVLSPWGQNRVVLIVTGLSDAAVRKASQAMASEALFPGMSGPVALVREVSPSSASDDVAPVKIDITFADLGYPDQVIEGGGSVELVEYWFEVPLGWQLTEDAFVELHFGHSRLIDYASSGLTVLLNREPAASIQLADENAEGGQVRLSLVDAAIRPGEENRLGLEVNAPMPGVCADDTQAWVIIKDSSKISLAHREEAEPILDLEVYPNPFILNPSLADVLFVLPDTSTVNDWETALRLAASLGDAAAGVSMAPVGAFGHSYPDHELANYHILAIGRPTRNTLIQEVNAQLPQPFLPGSDEIEQRLDDVVFRLPPGLDLGYAELIPSPWNETRALLAATGTTDTGVNWMVDVLAGRPWALRSGNLALTRDERVSTLDTRGLTRAEAAAASATAVPEMTPVAIAEVATTPTPASPPSPTPDIRASQPGSAGPNRPAWLIPVVAATALIVIVIFAFALRQARLRG